ncbi:MAG: hypothetical protein FWF11_01725 [Coriobacteriia bacterium]|nr:hypothetical protein [Coriobacteriia bacterium]
MSTEHKHNKLDQDAQDFADTHKENQQDALVKTAAPSRKKQSVFSDSYIRFLMLVAALTVIGGLLTIIFAMYNGVLNLEAGRATTAEEFAMKRAEAFIGVEETAENYGRLARAQIANNRFIEAEETITLGRSLNLPDEERNQALEYAAAVLAQARGDYDVAIERYENVMRQLREDFDRAYNSDISPNWARAFGMHPNYYDSAFFLAWLYGEQGDFERKLELLDTAISGNPTAADLFVDRGNTKLELGDIEGAIADFNEALRFIPDDEEALAGLQRAEGN